MPSTRRKMRLVLGLVLAAASATVAPAAERGLLGSYLAGRQATISNDYAAAAEYYTKALVRDPGNPALLEAALIAQTALGNIDAAVPIARRLRQTSPEGQLAEIVLLADQLRKREFEAVIADFDAGRDAGPLINGLSRAWALLGKGEVAEALAAFDTFERQQGLAVFGAYHKALALAVVGDFEGAERLLSGEEGPGIGRTRRGVIAHAQVLGQLERPEDALAVLDAAFGADPDPAIQALRADLAEGRGTPFDIVRDPLEGQAEVFFTVAGALNNEAEDTFTLLYSRVAEALSPRHTDAILLSAAVFERQEQWELATAAYNRILREDPAYHFAELGRAEALRASGRSEAAIEVLMQLAKSHSGLPDVHRALGDALRMEERYEEAAAAYDAAIAALPVEDPSHWVLYYVRGIAHERGDRWPQAEADFRKALALEPDQPQVLNYLGYSYLEQKVNLDEALAMIQRAVEQRPDDGHIVDSLGWALYRLGRYREAVEPMERAASLMPVDPVINDHLGDVYWAVGRKIEAEFQWKRALSFAPEEAEAERIRRKLAGGLDLVLAEEGSDPIAVANDGG